MNPPYTVLDNEKEKASCSTASCTTNIQMSPPNSPLPPPHCAVIDPFLPGSGSEEGQRQHYRHVVVNRRSKSPPAINVRLCITLMITTVLVSTLAICACVFAATSAIEEHVLAELIEYQQDEKRFVREENQRKQIVGSVTDLNSRVSTGGLSSLIKRNANRRQRRRRRRGRRGRGRDANRQRHHNQKSALHLQISVNPASYDKYDDVVDGRYFVWSEGDPHRMANFRYVRHPTLASPHDVWGIKVRRPGLYQIYSQVVLTNRNPRPYPYYCVQEIVQIRSNREEKVLLKSFATQHDVARMSQVHPSFDTVYQQGVFFLNVEDHVRVKPCDNAEFSNVAGDKEAFYFGIIQLE